MKAWLILSVQEKVCQCSLQAIMCSSLTVYPELPHSPYVDRRDLYEQEYFPPQPTVLSPPSTPPNATDRSGHHDGTGASPVGNDPVDGNTHPAGHHHSHHVHNPLQQLHFKQRVKHFTWTWFTMTMATGGIANVLSQVPYDFPGLFAIGCIFFLGNIVLWIFNAVMITLRFRLHPGTFMQSILHPTESLFIPAWLISLGTILINITEYGLDKGKTGGWLVDTMNVLFWVYCGLAVTFSCGIYLIMWSTQTFTISQMTPVWIFPAYPLLVIGPHASVLALRLPDDRAIQIIVGGFIFQGIGFMVSLMIYAAFIYRLMTQKLPQESLRPGMFISVGPSGFTIAGIVGMGQHLPDCVPKDFMGDGELAGRVSMIMANWAGLWLWGLAFWFFLVSVFAHWSTVRHGRWHFAMTWYSYVFPNTGKSSLMCLD